MKKAKVSLWLLGLGVAYLCGAALAHAGYSHQDKGDLLEIALMKKEMDMAKSVDSLIDLMAAAHNEKLELFYKIEINKEIHQRNVAKGAAINQSKEKWVYEVVNGNYLTQIMYQDALIRMYYLQAENIKGGWFAKGRE